MSTLCERILSAVKICPQQHRGFGLDFTQLFADPDLFIEVNSNLVPPSGNYDVIAGIEAMGLPFAAAAADANHKPFFPIRRAGRLAGEVARGEERLTDKSTVKFEVSTAIKNKAVLLIDDTISSGITMAAASKAIQAAGGMLAAISVVIAIPQFHGAEIAQGLRYYSLAKLTIDDAHPLPTC